MVLASTLDTLSLAKLVELADKIVEVAAPTVATVQNQQKWNKSDLKFCVQGRPHRSPTPTRSTSSTDTVAVVIYTATGVLLLIFPKRSSQLR